MNLDKATLHLQLHSFIKFNIPIDITMELPIIDKFEGIRKEWAIIKEQYYYMSQSQYGDFSASLFDQVVITQ